MCEGILRKRVRSLKIGNAALVYLDYSPASPTTLFSNIIDFLFKIICVIVPADSLFSVSDSAFCSLHILICIFPGLSSSLTAGWVREQAGKEESNFASPPGWNAGPVLCLECWDAGDVTLSFSLMTPVCSAGTEKVPNSRAPPEQTVPPEPG